HTLSFYGAGGERLGQWSSTTAVLRNEVSNTGSIWRIRDWNSENFQEWKTSLLGASNGMYYKTIHQALEIRTYLRSEPMSVLYLVSILLLLGICLALLQTGTFLHAIQTQLFTPLTLMAMLTLVTNCNGFLPNEDGEAPWAMAPLLIPPGTPSVIGTPASPGSGVPTPGTPITGFLFFINDHLGSVTMALDGQGNRIGGGEWGGVSRVAYKPYGEINRSDSGGPDVFRYKYTGQEEDRETGLYYYKSRYYDPMIGRFTQADSIFDASRPNSQDLYMYVEGNPINHTDPSGHSVSWGAIAAMALPMFTLPAIAAAAVIGAVVATAAILAFTAALGAVSMIAAVAAAGVIGVGIAVLGLSSYIGTTLAASSLFVIPAAVATVGFAASTAMMVVSSAGVTLLAAGAVALGAATFALMQVGAVGMGATVLAALAGSTLIYTVIGMAAIPVSIAIVIGIPIVTTAVATAAFALGHVLTPLTTQAYIAGGYSKSSWNKIRWDEKAARKWACYASFGQMAAVTAYAIIYGLPGLGVGANAAGGSAHTLTKPFIGSLLANEIPFVGLAFKDVLLFQTIVSFHYYLLTGNFEQAIYAFGDLVSPIPVSTPVQAGKFVGKTCEGDL
ncbi:RHS repeat-associated core domain-containing protein, partial [Leptospira gomenensis]